MRALISAVGMLFLVIGWNGSARADLLVASFDSFQVLRYDDSGAFVGSFLTGLPNDRPIAMALGADGNLYVAVRNFDSSFDGIRRFNGQTGVLIDTFASGGGLVGPIGIVFGPDGNLYVSSFGLEANSKIIRYNGATGAYMGDFVPAGSGGLQGAEGLAFGPDGNLYVTSRMTNQVLRYHGSTGAFLGVFATGGQNGPVDLTFGPDGNLYVLTTESQVLRYDGSTGAFISVFTNIPSQVADGSGLVFGPDGHLYVSTGFVGNSVQRFDGVTGRFINQFVPPGRGGLAYATDLLFLIPPPLPISIDIIPRNSRNNINLKNKKKIKVAVLTTASFSATTVNVDTVRFGVTGTEAAPIQSSFDDVDRDGDVDLILQFNVRDTGIKCGDTSASITGKNLSGQLLKGADAINTKGCKHQHD